MEKENIYAKRIDQVQMSSIRVVMEKVEKLKSQGKSVVSLCAGEPDFNTPEGIKKATIEALNDNQTHYSSNRGYAGLRQKVSQLLKQQTTIDYDSDQEIIMTCGCSEAINNTCQAFIDEGDEVIIFTPAFVSYQNTVLLCKGIPVEIPLKPSNGFQIDLDEVKNKITDKPVKIFELRDQIQKYMEELNMNPKLIERNLNVGFSGGEKKKNEILQMLVLEPKLVILDETDSGLDVDAVRTVSKGIEMYKNEENAVLIITHNTRILENLKVDYVHILVDGKIVKTGDASLAQEIEENGYSQYK